MCVCVVLYILFDVKIQNWPIPTEELSHATPLCPALWPCPLFTTSLSSISVSWFLQERYINVWSCQECYICVIF